MKRKILTITLSAALVSIGFVTLLGHGQSRAQSGAGTITGRVTVVGGGRSSDRGEVVVYVEGTSPHIPESARSRAQMHQRDLQFAPDLLVVPRGSSVDFPNEDRVFHNVFSLSRPKRFDLGLYRRGETREVTFDRPGKVDVYCNIHPDMVGQIMVLDTVHYAIASSTGEYVIPNVPAGTWNVVAAPRFGDSVNAEVRVTAGGTLTQAFEVRARRRPTGHRRKDGTPYGRYR